MYRSCSSRKLLLASALTRALAIAEATSLYTGSLAPWGANLRMARASWACLPRIMLTTRRAFIGVTRMCRTRAIDSTISLPPSPPRLAAATLLVVLHVSTEGAGGSKLSELVPNHGLGDEHRDVLATVVHRDRVAEHGRDDHRAARPGLDHVLAVGLVLRGDLAEKVLVDEGALFKTAWHFLPFVPF